MMKKTYRQLARRKCGGISDLLAKTRFKDENDNLSALIKRNIIHKTRERKFEFAFNKLQIVRERCGIVISNSYQELSIR